MVSAKTKLIMPLMAALSLALCACVAAPAFAADASFDTKVDVDYVASGDLEVTGNDLFDLEGLSLPGDTVTSTLTVTNHAGNACAVYLQSLEGASTVREGANPLMDEITLSIKDEAGATVYDGVFSATELNDALLLANIAPQGSYAVTFTAHIPAALDNRYAMSEAVVPWRVTVAEDVPPSPDPYDPYSGPYDRTGASVAALAVLAMAGVALGAVVVVLGVRRARKGEKDE